MAEKVPKPGYESIGKSGENTGLRGKEIGGLSGCRFGSSIMSAATSDGVVVTLEEVADLSGLERDWRGLELRADCSFFTSWSWIGCWLECLPSAERPRLLRAVRQGRTVGLGLFGEHRTRRHGFFSARSLFLNSTGNTCFDEVTVEHNSIVAERANANAIRRTMMDFLLCLLPGWEELHFPGVDAAGAWLGQDTDGWKVLRETRRFHYVDLDEVRTRQGGYLALLSRNTRQQIRRSAGEYARRGATSCVRARCAKSALDYLSALRELHQAYWKSRGFPGSFANPFFCEFHERLVHRCWGRGEIQILRLEAGGAAFGYLYNFVHRDWVVNYQSGFDYGFCEKHNRPGLVAHALAVEENAREGRTRYDFLGGESQYKRSLGRSSGEMEWTIVQRDLLKFRVENRLRALKRGSLSLLRGTRDTAPEVQDG